MKYKFFWITFVVLVSFPIRSHCQKPILELHFDTLAKMEVIFLNSGNAHIQYHFREILNSSIDDLKVFLRNNDQYKVAYALLALAHKQDVIFSEIIENFVYDARTVYVKELNDQVYIGELTLRIVNNDLIYLKTKFTEDEVKSIYTNLLRTKPKPVFYKYLLSTIRPYDESYEAIKEYYTVYKVPEALMSLIQFKNAEVVTFIKEELDGQNWNFALKAIEIIPIDVFLPELKAKGVELAKSKYLHGGKEFGIFNALASYQSLEAYNIMETILKASKKKYKKMIYKDYVKDSLNKFPPPQHVILPRCINEANLMRAEENSNDF